MDCEYCAEPMSEFWWELDDGTSGIDYLCPDCRIEVLHEDIV